MEWKEIKWVIVSVVTDEIIISEYIMSCREQTCLQKPSLKYLKSTWNPIMGCKLVKFKALEIQGLHQVMAMIEAWRPS